MTAPPALNCSPRRRLPAPMTTANCTPRLWTFLICWAILSVSSILMPLLPGGPNPSPLSLSRTRLNLGLRGSTESSIIGIHPIPRASAANPWGRATFPRGFAALVPGPILYYINPSYSQHAVSRRDIPAVDDLAVLDDLRELMQRAGRADVGGQRVGDFSRLKAVGFRRLDHEMFLVVQDMIPLHIQEDAPHAPRWIAGHRLVAEIERHARWRRPADDTRQHQGG